MQISLEVVALDSGLYARAIELLTAIDSRYPFGPFSKQVQMDLVYAHYQSGNTEQALQKGFDKIFKERGKVDYMLRYKTTSTANGLSYDLAAASAPALKQLDSFTLEANSSFND